MEKKTNHLSLLLSHYINIDTTGSCCCFWTLEKDRAADGSPCEGPLAMRGIFMRRARIYHAIKRPFQNEKDKSLSEMYASNGSYLFASQ